MIEFYWILTKNDNLITSRMSFQELKNWCINFIQDQKEKDLSEVEQINSARGTIDLAPFFRKYNFICVANMNDLERM